MKPFILLLLTWTQCDAATVECWNVWHRETVTNAWKCIATNKTNRYESATDKPTGFYTVSASNASGETWAIK